MVSRVDLELGACTAEIGLFHALGVDVATITVSGGTERITVLGTTRHPSCTRASQSWWLDDW